METIISRLFSKGALVMLFAMLSATGCRELTPQERHPALQGDFYDGNAEHRPGQPCLLCHGTKHVLGVPGGDAWEIAGTVYPELESPADAGLEGVRVEITDAEGELFVAVTNKAGNFLFEHDWKAKEPRDVEPGWVAVPKQPVFPLTVEVVKGEVRNKMHTKIWRTGGCADCHGATVNESSVGRVILFGEDGGDDDDDDDDDYRMRTHSGSVSTHSPELKQ